jgi:hypothetical protein
MKKLIPYILFILLTNMLAAQLIEPVSIIQSPAVSDTKINIDGIDAELSYSVPVVLEYYIDNATMNAIVPEATDLSCSFRTCWDWEYLYVFAKILDDTLVQYGDFSNHWELDAFKLHFNPDTSQAEGSAYLEDGKYLAVSRGEGPNVSKTQIGSGLLDDFTYSIRELALPEKGWTLEMAIPWRFILYPDIVGNDIMEYSRRSMGLEIAVYDSDIAENGRDMFGFWDADPTPWEMDDAWQNTKTFGIIKLTGLPVKVDTVVIEKHEVVQVNVDIIVNDTIEQIIQVCPDVAPSQSEQFISISRISENNLKFRNVSGIENIRLIDLKGALIGEVQIFTDVEPVMQTSMTAGNNYTLVFLFENGRIESYPLDL